MTRLRKTNRPYNAGVAESNRKRVKHGGCVGRREGEADLIYEIWCSMKARCFNQNATHFHRYGGRGISIYPEWRDSFEAFRDYMGVRPEKATLDRIDNEGNYEPENVRWSSRKGQANNRATNVVITHEGLTMTLKQWSEHRGEKYGLLSSRWKKGLRGNELFAPPEYNRSALYTHKGESLTLPDWVKKTGVKYVTLKYRVNTGLPLLLPHEE